MLSVERNGPWLTLRINRPEVGNALNGEVMASLKEELTRAAGDRSVRAVVVTGAGKLFSAGADLNWMAKMKDASAEENLRDAEESAALFNMLYDLPHPTVAAVNGPARGGGVGIIAACDFAIASNTANFAFTEVRVGVIPALISPFVLRKLGESRTRHLFLTGETFTAEQAAAWGLVDRVVGAGLLQSSVSELLQTLLHSAPGAIARIKELIRRVRSAAPEEATAITAQMIAEARATPEAIEGMAAFLEKRLPSWAAAAATRKT